MLLTFTGGKGGKDGKGGKGGKGGKDGKGGKGGKDGKGGKGGKDGKGGKGGKGGKNCPARDPTDIGPADFVSPFEFKSGRTDCPTAPYTTDMNNFPSTTMNLEEVLDFFDTELNMTPEGVSWRKK
jgi:hypothetical protein